MPLPIWSSQASRIFHGTFFSVISLCFITPSFCMMTRAHLARVLFGAAC